MKLNNVDYCAAACADACVEGLSMQSLQAAKDVSMTPKQFFYAVQAAVKLKELLDERH